MVRCPYSPRKQGKSEQVSFWLEKRRKSESWCSDGMVRALQYLSPGNAATIHTVWSSDMMHILLCSGLMWNKKVLSWRLSTPKCIHPKPGAGWAVLDRIIQDIWRIWGCLDIALPSSEHRWNCMGKPGSFDSQRWTNGKRSFRNVWLDDHYAMAEIKSY